MNYLKGDGQVFDNFYHIDCNVQDVINNNYQEMQDKFCNQRLDASATYMRCFKEPEVETKLWTDTYRTRQLLDGECDMIKQRLQNRIDDQNKPFTMASGLKFREHSKLRNELQNVCNKQLQDELCRRCQNN
jgi:hypothetical protein